MGNHWNPVDFYDQMDARLKDLEYSMEMHMKNLAEIRELLDAYVSWATKDSDPERYEAWRGMREAWKKWGGVGYE